MDADQTRPHVEAAIADFQEISARIDKEAKTREALGSLLQSYMRLFPEFRSLLPKELRPVLGLDDLTQMTDRPRGQTAIMRVLKSATGQWWTVGDVLNELDRRGWLPTSANPGAAVRTALERLAAADHGVIKDKKPGGGPVVFRYQPSFEEGAPD